MNVFRRAGRFESQLKAIKSQSLPPQEILIWENGAETVGNSYGLLRARSDVNLGVWARFAHALNSTGDFVWVIDDDVVPGEAWLQNAIETLQESGDSVVGSRGLRFHSPRSYLLYDELGPNGPSNEVSHVDILGHNWIFPREWLSAFWGEYSNAFPSKLAGEDIHLSFAAQKHFGARTLVPPHPENDLRVWGELPANTGQVADGVGISHDLRSLRRFERALRHYVDMGFRLVNDQGLGAPTAKEYLTGTVAHFAPGAVLKAARLFGLEKRRNRS